MIVRMRQKILASVAATSTVLLSTCPVIQGAPVVVTNYRQLVGTIGSNDDYNTGERFSREGLVLVHQGEKCAPNFERLGLSGFDKHPQMYALVSVDAAHADKELLSRLGVNPADLSDPQLPCPALSIIPRRSPVVAPAVILPKADADGSYHDPAVETQLVSVGIVNDLDVALDIHFQWWDDPVMPTHIRTLAPAEETWMKSYRTTYIVALDKETREEVWRHLVKGHGLFTVADRTCTAETCGTSEAAEMPQDEASRDARSKSHQMLLERNKQQPAKLPWFTEIGFRKMTVPDDVWDVVKTYYEDNKNSPTRESWSKNSAMKNNVEAPSYLVKLPEDGALKEGIFEGLRPIMEEWAGVELEKTSCYGVRVYTNTTWELNHVSVKASQVLNIMMQVAQDVEEDWPLMIYDHAGNDHNITMKPRDMVLYEGATCIHGRPSTFNGNFYANAFVHYKPKDPAKWSNHIDSK